MPQKTTLGMYWASSCGGCEIALVNIQEKLLTVAEHFDLIFCPCLMDTKKHDVEAMPDGHIGITFFNGAIRTEENEEMAVLLRQKSKILIAFGSCACEGCIPALSNLHSKKEHLDAIYINNLTVDNPGGVLPQTSTTAAEGTLTIPKFFERVSTLDEVVEVDFKIPGCPPESQQVWNVIDAVIKGATLPPKGSVLGAGKAAVCQECPRRKEEKKVKRFYRTWEKNPDAETCLLEQGIVCMGISTREGCGALCPQVNMPCTGCYGPAEGVEDQGAKMVSALGSMIDIGDVKGVPEEELVKRIQAAVDTLPDPAGFFYKFGLAASMLKGKAE